jgi:hypothetical protein
MTAAGRQDQDGSGVDTVAHQTSACTVKGELSPLRACGSRTWVSTPRRTDPRLPVPITLLPTSQRGNLAPRGTAARCTARGSSP